MTSQMRYLTVIATINEQTGRASQPVKVIKTVFSKPNFHAEMNLLLAIRHFYAFQWKRALGAAVSNL